MAGNTIVNMTRGAVSGAKAGVKSPVTWTALVAALLGGAGPQVISDMFGPVRAESRVDSGKLDKVAAAVLGEEGRPELGLAYRVTNLEVAIVGDRLRGIDPMEDRIYRRLLQAQLPR